MDYLGSAHWENNFKGYETKNALSGWGVAIGRPLADINGEEILENNVVTIGPERHFLTLAPTRSGKGVSLIIPNLLQYEGSAIVIDPKGENAWVTAKCRRESIRQKTIILDPWGEVNRRYGDLAGEQETIARFNPLSILDPTSQHYADDLAYLSDALIINQGKDPHWDDSARELVAGLIAFAVEKYGEAATLPMVRLMLSKPAEDVAGFAKEAQRFGIKSVAARKLGRFVNDSKEIASIVSTALTQTAFLDSETLGESLSHTDFSFSDLVENRATIYLVLPVDKLQTYGRWLRLMVSIGIRTVARNIKPLGLPVLFILDEFGTIGRLSAVAQAYGLMAGLQMCIWAFVQDLAQLKRDYPDDWETFIGNSQGITAFNAMDQFTCEYLSKMLGTKTSVRMSAATAGAIEQGIENPYSMTDQIFPRDLMQPSEIRVYRQAMGIYIGRHSPLMFSKIIYYKEPFFIQLARQNPHFKNLKVDQKEEARQKIINTKSALKYLDHIDLRYDLPSIFNKKTTVYLRDGKKQTFTDETSLVEWVKSIV